MKSEPIQKIRKRFHREWLLIAVDEMDPSVPVLRRGHLLSHSKDRDEIYRAMMRHKELTLVAYSDDRLPAGYALAL